jgi:hypothetical protein
VDVAYRGRGYDHVIVCGEHTLTSVFAPVAQPRGASVRVAVEEHGCVAYPI